MSGFVYIMTNKLNSVLYTGSTSDIVARVKQHKEKYFPNSFTAKYNINKLVYLEFFETREEAYIREHQIKRRNRIHKIKLIELKNPMYRDLINEILQDGFDKFT
ncbi:hypothetical protein A2533_04440 [Candidatus Falkowbacteria bacterium RIFOXYD2_FULL_35_9]|uniref:GIY-YIG domain-containing protein n=1 Tax=Candidatus Falkowbacteria bacterium RIFOXYC2_FULL_36_12 TaxID=1798002 RepID=A0A1F5T0V8_9BACT|nr:MAG: hypothetical protein A2300_04095 [Candidatus Falkowbacteria bacterium RIFOXYB2_FULL_35_7]OGF32383.1 MAG: hypothetical protein A2478_03630 [Candidatus Falkowbacteria bacterium RIFOXYC2_FULL_36_12]OGF34733.1 MAG: hypothetical protein A2223_00925 [Candidatus Falkowbacteria bacterium RIFOXYA2_FULL_35_8]OGF48366.1 MAG: hypothetical protein A2533_04440 [Candidatus Falkowbacteria bacterium RIFOXYD2_FULL_35_9]